MTVPEDCADDRARVTGALPKRWGVPTTSCRHCGHPIALLTTPWGAEVVSPTYSFEIVAV